MAKLNRKQRLRRRHVHIRKRVNGVAGKPRLLVRRSIRHIEASLIDDVAGRTILSVTSKSGNFSTVKKESKTEQASRLGKLIAERAKENGIMEVVFDRGGHPYHGRVKTLAENARKAGLRF